MIQYGSRSPDGRWWWDGQRWQPVAPPTEMPAAGSRPPMGPLGRPRSIGTSILLAVVTLGIYTFVWTYQTHDEIRRHSGIGIGGGIGLLIYFLLSPVTFFLIPDEIRQMHEAAGFASPVRSILGLWFLLPIVGSIIWFVEVQRALNRYWAARGAPWVP